MFEPRSRADFAALCNELGLVEAVEIGTDCAQFAVEFLQRWNGNTLFCVDPYKPYNEMDYDRTFDMMIAANRLAPFGWHAKLIRDYSPQAEKHIPQRIPIQFVYIDGDHSRMNVVADILAWWKRLMPGGILAGHDYDAALHPAIIKEVNAHAERHGLTVNVVDDPVFAPSWWMRKPS